MDLFHLVFGDLFQLLFGFHGRINRAKYWLAMVINGVAGLFVSGIVFIGSSGMHPAFVITELVLLFFIPGLISFIAISFRRLHDRDKSGWWLLVFYGLPAVSGHIPDAAGPTLQFIVWLASLAVAIWGLVELGFLRGAAGSNAYGSDPLASATAGMAAIDESGATQ